MSGFTSNEFRGGGRGRGRGGGGGGSGGRGGFGGGFNDNCFLCQQPGHIARNCPNGPYCPRCRQQGHTPKECRNQAQGGSTGPATGGATAVPPSTGPKDLAARGGAAATSWASRAARPSAPAGPAAAPFVPGAAPFAPMRIAPALSTSSSIATPLLPVTPHLPPVPVVPVTTNDISPDQLILQSKVHNPSSDKKDTIISEMYRRGLRTDFGVKGQASEISTNFLTITHRPAQLFVYKIILIRGWTDEDEPKPVYVKNKFDQQGVFDHMKAQLPTLPNFNCWVTDYDMIWSTQPLFHAREFDVMPSVMRDITATNPNNHKPVTVEEAYIQYDRVIDLRKTIGQLFHNSTGRTKGEDDSAVLVRGLNAMVTLYASRAQGNGNVFPSGANKFYFRDPPGELGHTLRALHGSAASVRPGSLQLLLNISPKCSPFLMNLTVHGFITGRGRAAKKGAIASALKGVKVRITYNKKPDFLPHEREKFITGIGDRVDRQLVNPGHRNNAVQTVKDYYEQALFPNTGLRLDAASFAINVGGQPPKAVTKGDGKGKGKGKADGDQKAQKWTKKQEDPEWYPAEYLEIIGDPAYHGLLSGRETSQMIGYALKLPPAQQSDIEQRALQMFGIKDPQFQHLLETGFGITIDPNLGKVPCRFLSPPNLLYARGNLRIDKASWNLTGVRQLASQCTTTRVPILDLTGLRDPNPPRNARPAPFNQHFPYMLKDAMNSLGLPGHAVELQPFQPNLDPSGTGTNLDFGISEAELVRIFNHAISQNRTTPVDDTKDITLVVVILTVDQDLYATIKRVAELRMGLKTVCCVADKMQQFGDPKPNRQGGVDHVGKQNCANIALKLNIKGESDNHRVDLSAFTDLYAVDPSSSGTRANKTANTIVLGADVTHPIGNCAPGCPSVAAVVGSVDDHFAHFPGSMRLQRSRQEAITDLQHMVKERLLDWAAQHSGKLPTAVLFYRDGVSESQFEQVQREEIPRIEEAFALAAGVLEEELRRKEEKEHEELYEDDSKAEQHDAGSAQPDKEDSGSEKEVVQGESDIKRKVKIHPFKLTFIVVGKRHNTRFYAIQQSDTFEAYDRDTRRNEINGNVLPGCVVDQNITHPYTFDFYLQSHMPIKGTGRSAHYFVLENSMELSADRLQEITHAFCYNYARATKGVSYCAPAYYADRLCDRGRAYIRHWLVDGENHCADRDKGKNETSAQFNDYVRDYLHDDNYNRHHQGTPQKYSQPRQNPWHENLATPCSTCELLNLLLSPLQQSPLRMCQLHSHLRRFPTPD